MNTEQGKQIKINTGRHSITSKISGLTLKTNLSNYSGPEYETHGFLGRAGALYDLRQEIRKQSAAEKCDCEVMDEKNGFHDTSEVPHLREFDYGEPLKTQCLRIDFTPIPGLDDNPQRLDKVTMFWNYIRSCRQLKPLMVLPDAIDAEPSKATTSTTAIPEPDIDGIQWVQNPATSFKLQTMGKLPGSKYCPQTGVTDDYVINDENIKFGGKTEKLPPLTKPSGTDMKSCHCKKKTDTYKLCQVMDDFDRKHPKSMEPPGHPPPLSYALLQRVHSSVALPSDKRKKIEGCDCPKPLRKPCHCCGRESVADIWSVKQ